MIKSMTGFGRGDYEENGRSFTVEVKSINHRYTDISVKLPRQLSYLEDNVRKHVAKSVSRGKVDIFISQDRFSKDDISVSIDDTLAGAYVKALNELRDKYKLHDDLSVSVISRFPDVLSVTKAEDDDLVWNTLSIAIDRALERLVNMRKREGQKLAEDIIERRDFIKSLVEKIEERSPIVVQEYRVKLGERIKEIAGDISVDEARIASEVAIFADRSSITEEIVRLYSHLDQLVLILQENEPVGRKLDFLVQEINREANTIGSKASDLEITRYVVDTKSEIEKIREQIQNIE